MIHGFFKGHLHLVVAVLSFTELFKIAIFTLGFWSTTLGISKNQFGDRFLCDCHGFIFSPIFFWDFLENPWVETIREDQGSPPVFRTPPPSINRPHEEYMAPEIIKKEAYGLMVDWSWNPAKLGGGFKCFLLFIPSWGTDPI